MNWLALRNLATSYASRGDVDAALLNTLLPLAEDRIYNGMTVQGRRVGGLRLEPMIASVNPFTIGALPATSLGVARLSVQIGGRWVPMEFRTATDISMWEGITGNSRIYTMRAGSVVVGSAAGNTYWLHHYARPATPVADADENIVMALYPRVYHYALMAEIANWLRSAEMLAQHQGNLIDAMQSAQDADDEAKWGAGPLRTIPG
jgi:hypothetical protein